MIFDEIKILKQHGKQYISDLQKPVLPATFRGLPQISPVETEQEAEQIAALCPTGAIQKAPFGIDMGKCLFCGACALAFPERIRFTNQYKIASNSREGLIITAQQPEKLIKPELIRTEIKKMFGSSLKLRQVSAGGDASAEMELGATTNVNFDMGRFGIDFVASPRHADGIVITGPITENMAEALEICYQAMAEPKIIILVGTDAISGGLFAHSPAIDRSFLKRYPVDLYVPGNPPHPLTFINGVMEMLGKFKSQL